MLENLGITNLWTYLIGVIFITLVPGPNSLFVLTSSAKYGVKNGYKAALGVFTGDALLIFLSFLGVASLVKTSPLFFSVIKYAGAAYLFYLGIKTLYSVLHKKESATDVDGIILETKGTYKKAVFLSLLNPKMIIFYVSFFIQFIDPAYPSAGVPFFVLGVILEVCSMFYLSMLIFGAVAVTNMVKHNKKLSKFSNSCIGAVFLMFGAKLALTA
ncbi:leucine efflux protein LeuE [Providencia alcalifaciens]|uniref:leucine efflux protein LeuE n=1 Tax=Providencia alcalifaciens TaxID=126385 RepID=UPI001CE0F93C|nr:leucine efflux protein LeuE [Providencia alcalifaciens]UBX48573.1 leucine efflux protein LeuE [Providencia alcalifaciens]